MSRPYSRSPGGLLIPLHATLKGRVRWQVLDERGVPEIPRTPSGIPVGPVEGVEQDNLITNNGLDRVGQLNLEQLLLTGAHMRRRLAVGTGSTAPDVTDTTLDNEVQRASAHGAFPAGNLDHEPLDTIANVYRTVIDVTRLVTMTADRNLTEYGFAELTTADICIRELLRDGGGTPITVSLLTDKTLRVDHSLTVELPAPANGVVSTLDVEEYDAGNNLTGTTTYDVVNGFIGTGAGRPFLVWHPIKSLVRVRRVTEASTFDRTSVPLHTPTGANGIGGTGVNMDVLAYVGGTYERTKRQTLSPALANDPWYGILYSDAAPSGERSGYVTLFTNPASYTKADTDTFQFGFISTWARA